MEPIKIDPAFERWVEEVMAKGLEQRNIKVTSTAQQGIAYLLQAQLNEHTVTTPQQVLAKANALLEGIQNILRPRYSTPTLNINRALHLITHVNSVLHVFPWETTMELDESRLAQHAGFVKEPEKAGMP
jgi:hypothetical protein